MNRKDLLTAFEEKFSGHLDLIAKSEMILDFFEKQIRYYEFTHQIETHTRYLCIKSLCDERGHYVEGQIYYFKNYANPDYFSAVVDEKGCAIQLSVQHFAEKIE